MSDEWRINLIGCTDVILQELTFPKITRKSVALTYAMAMKSAAQKADAPDWKVINEAIIASVRRFHQARRRDISRHQRRGQIMMTDDRMERCARLASAYDPYPLDPSPPEIDRPPADRLELRLAVTLGVLAAGSIALGIAWGLS